MSWVPGAHQARESLKTQRPLTKVLKYCPPSRSSCWHPELNPHPYGYKPTPYKLDQPTRCVQGSASAYKGTNIFPTNEVLPPATGIGPTPLR
ncbi:hypothetical protein A2U01_0015886, partial [Trifolium medium]|nr:hypothetical protein [Trifolium medium]